MKRNELKFIILIAPLWLILVSVQSTIAKEKEILYCSSKYAMGDNDTKNDARRVALMEAKRLCLEKAGTYIESFTEVSKFQLTKDEMRVYAAGVVRIEPVSEEFRMVGENVTLFLKAQAEVDIDDIKDKFQQIKADTNLAERIKEQEKQMQQLEKEIKDLQEKLTTEDFQKSARLREERKEAFDKMGGIEANREAIMIEIQNKTQWACEKIELGMTPQEVLKVIGDPRSRADCGSYLYFNYGNVWVVFQHGIVKCIVKSKPFKKCWPCGWYKKTSRVK